MKANQGNVTLFIGGNSWSLDNGTIDDKGYHFTSLPAKFSSYIYTSNSAPAEICISLKNNVTLQIETSIGQQMFHLTEMWASEKPVTYFLGEFNFKAGYNRIDITLYGQGDITKGSGLANLLYIDGDLKNLTYVTDKDWFYWGRRGPSGHIRPILPNCSNVSYYYSEITVPAGYDKIGSYYMANGFGEGYFGIQVNTATQRKILFSVWSGYNTNSKNAVPSQWTVKLKKAGPGVQIAQFQGQGCGGQSFLVFPWVTDTTYKFLTRAQPLNTDQTVYTAWFNDPKTAANGGWRLIASWIRPKIRTYLTNFYHFIECFDTKHGNETRMAYYGNEWIYDDSNTWKESFKMSVTRDNTANSNQRRDVEGGVVNGNKYFLKNGGFFSSTSAENTQFTRAANKVPPNIDLAALNAMVG